MKKTSNRWLAMLMILTLVFSMGLQGTVAFAEELAAPSQEQPQQEQPQQEQPQQEQPQQEQPQQEQPQQEQPQQEQPQQEQPQQEQPQQEQPQQEQPQQEQLIPLVQEISAQEDEMSAQGNTTRYDSTDPLTHNTVTVDFGTSLSNAINALDNNVTIRGTKNHNSQHVTASIAWTIANYNGSIPASYTATGTINPPNSWTGTIAPVKATVIVAPKPLPTVQLKVNTGGTVFIGITEYKAQTQPYTITCQPAALLTLKAYSNAGYQGTTFASTGSTDVNASGNTYTYKVSENGSITVSFSEKTAVHGLPYYVTNGAFSGYNGNGTDPTEHNPKGDSLAATLAAAPSKAFYSMGEAAAVTLTVSNVDGDASSNTALNEVDFYRADSATAIKTAGAVANGYNFNDNSTLPATEAALITAGFQLSKTDDFTVYTKTINYEMVDRYNATAGAAQLSTATATLVVKVPVAPAVVGIDVTPSSAYVQQGATQQLTAVVTVVGGASQAVTWKSSSPAVTVDANGLVTVSADAEPVDYTITATSVADATKSDTSIITVTEAYYTRILYLADDKTGGAVPTDTTKYHYGDVVTVQGPNTIEKTGFNFLGWIGQKLEMSSTSANDFDNNTLYKANDQFRMGEMNITLLAQWEAKPFEPTTPVVPEPAPTPAPSPAPAATDNRDRADRAVETTAIAPEATPLAAPVIPAPVATVQAVPAVIQEEIVPLGVPVLPKTGEVPASLFYGLGGILTAAGAFLKRK